MQLNSKDGYGVPLFGYAQIGDATPVAFNTKNHLGIPVPSSKSSSATEVSSVTYDKWHICDINSGIVYPSLVWATGDVAPPLSSCTKVDIVRVFA
jgi:hypothetical protein